MKRRRLLLLATSLLGVGSLSQCGLSVSTRPPATPAVEARPMQYPTSIPVRAAVTPAARLEPVRLAVLDEAPAPEPAPLPAPPERLVIADIGLDTVVVPLGWTVVGTDGAQESRWEDLPVGAAGWHRHSGRPGMGTNIVISGHHNIAGEVFRDLVLVEPGQRVSVWAEGREHRYVVAEKLILPERGVPEEQRRQNASWMQPTPTERLTLITCWPQSSNTHRLIVWARPDTEAS